MILLAIAILYSAAFIVAAFALSALRDQRAVKLLLIFGCVVWSRAETNPRDNFCRENGYSSEPHKLASRGSTPRPATNLSTHQISGERRALAMRVEAAGINQPATVVTAGETAVISITYPMGIGVSKPGSLDVYSISQTVSKLRGDGANLNVCGVDGDTHFHAIPKSGATVCMEPLKGVARASLPCASSRNVADDSFRTQESVQFRPHVQPFIDRIADIETHHDNATVGKAGERGSWQFTEAAWADVDAIRVRQGLPLFPFEQAHCDEIAREYALQYLGLLSRKLTAALGHPPTERQLYAAWNLGFKGFHRRGFSLQRIPTSTKRSIRRLEK